MRRFSPELVWRASEGCGYGIPDGWFFICSSRKEHLRNAIWREANSGRKRVYVGRARLGAESDGLAQISVHPFSSSTLTEESHHLGDGRLIPILFGWSHVIANRRPSTLPGRRCRVVVPHKTVNVCYFGVLPRFASSCTDFVVADFAIADLVGEPHAAGGFAICFANTR